VAVPRQVMQDIYEEVKTPYKYGLLLLPEAGMTYDCPSVFRHGDRWYMLYVQFDGMGYETYLAESDDLLVWNRTGKILTRTGTGWDANQAAGFIALQDTTWAGRNELLKHDDVYWLSYIGGALPGLEKEPLAIGLASTSRPEEPAEWTRIEHNPVLHRDQPNARAFEAQTLYKSTVILDENKTLGHPFVMYYNGKQKGEWVERIGMALSDDMVHWQRHGDGPVVDNGSGISGDPQLVRIGEVWVMFYFGATYRPKAFDTFACSHDLERWTKWDGPDLIEPSEPWDDVFAHKPWVIKHDGVVYHFYCAVGDKGRTIALATSEDMGRSALTGPRRQSE